MLRISVTQTTTNKQITWIKIKINKIAKWGMCVRGPFSTPICMHKFAAHQSHVWAGYHSHVYMLSSIRRLFDEGNLENYCLGEFRFLFPSEIQNAQAQSRYVVFKILAPKRRISNALSTKFDTNTRNFLPPLFSSNHSQTKKPL